MPKSESKQRSIPTSQGVSRKTMALLENALANRQAEPVEACSRGGRSNGVMVFAAWILLLLDQRLSGSYHVFSGGGKFPLRGSEQRIDTRKALRARINRAIAAGVLEACKPLFRNEVDSTAIEIPNVAPEPAKREPGRDIPLLGWQLDDGTHEVWVPTSWRESAEIHPTETYRLSADFEPTRGEALRKLGGTILGGVNGGLDSYLEQETEAIWANLQDSLRKQHSKTRHHYELKIDKVDKDLTGPLRGNGKALYLASSLTKLWHPSRVVDLAEAERILRGT